ncbi:MAG: YegP family protein [Clostridiales bacterium]|nr:YegP family protein [Clostridiales bacterium]
MGKFVIKKSGNGFTFSLKAGNGEIIGVGGEVLNALATCRNSIASVTENAQIAGVEDQTVDGYATEKCPKFEIYLDKAGEYRFRLKARNGEPILASEGYTAKASCKNGIESVRKNVVDAEVVDPE